MERLARRFPRQASRLVDWLENSVVNEASRELCVKNGDVEICLVPPRFVLVNLPDAAALIRIDHAAKTIEIVTIIELYGGRNEPAEWLEITRSARRSVKG
jgi:hypothetical protein